MPKHLAKSQVAKWPVDAATIGQKSIGQMAIGQNIWGVMFKFQWTKRISVESTYTIHMIVPPGRTVIEQ